MQFHKQAGSLEITLFSSPTPVRAGVADLSVMVQNAADKSPVQNATVKLHLSRTANGSIVDVFAPATHAKATNKLLYAANVNIPSAGMWQASVEVSAAGVAETASGMISVLPPQAPAVNYWAYIALLPFVILLFIFNQWLKRRRRFTYPQVRP